MDNILEVCNVSHSYDGRVSVLDDVTLSIPSGCIVGLIGPNGSGKSTLIKNIFDLLKLRSGSIRLSGLEHDSVAAREMAIYLSSNDYLPEFLTGGEYISTIAKLYGTDLDEADLDDAFVRFSMTGRHGDLIEDYSHGMRKKTQLISALLTRRPLTVIDETLNGIDVEALHICEKEFRQLRDQGLSVLLCTHDFSLLERLADRVIFLDLGQVVNEGETQDIIRQHGSLETMVFDHLDSDSRRRR